MNVLVSSFELEFWFFLELSLESDNFIYLIYKIFLKL